MLKCSQCTGDNPLRATGRCAECGASLCMLHTWKVNGLHLCLTHAQHLEITMYQTKEPRLAELDALSWERYARPYVELDVDKRNELREEVYETPSDNLS